MSNSKIVYKDDEAFVQDDILNSQDFINPELEIIDEPYKTRKLDPELKKFIFGASLFAVSMAIAVFVSSYAWPYEEIRHGGVVSNNLACSAIGIQLMKNLGNAIDAAVATAICEAIHKDNACGLLGGANLVYRQHKNNKSFMYNFIGNNPKDTHNKNLSRLGIPTLLTGLFTVHHDHGSLKWKDIIDPILEYADKLKKIDGLNTNSTIDILKNVSSENVEAFYFSSIIEEFANQNKNEFPNLRVIQEYSTKSEPSIIYRFHDYQVDISKPPSNGAILILFLNIMMSLNDEFKIDFQSKEYSQFVDKAASLSDTHVTLFTTENTEEILSLLTNKSYANDKAREIFNNSSITQLPKFDENEFFSTQTSDVVVVGPNDDIISMSMTLGLRANSTIKEIQGLTINSNNQPIINMSPIILSNQKMPCLLRLGATHRGTQSSPTELGRLILELVKMETINLHDAVSNTIHTTNLFQNHSDCQFVSIGKFKEKIIKDVQLPTSLLSNIF